MLSRLRRVAWTFFAVVGLYLAYSLLAVPFIEPSARERSSLLANASSGAANTARKLRGARLEALFSAGDWELDNPMVLETDRGMLLIRDYRSRPDGSLELKPCTLILYDASPEAEVGAGDRSQNCLLLRSPEGAVLHFDSPLDLARGQFGRLEGGWLVGPVTISSSESSPGADDGLDIRTGSVQINRQRITAPQEVIFRYGPNTGRGRDLIIDLDLPSASHRLPESSAQLPLGQIRSLELVHVENLRLQLNDPRRKAAGGDQPADTGSLPPILAEITCRGPFRFDVPKLTATLRDQVQVLRKNRDGPDDLLRCDLVSIFFAAAAPPAQPIEPPSPAAANKPAEIGLPEMSRLRVDRLTIEGGPAVMDMPSEDIWAQARLVEYSFTTGSVRVRDEQQARFRYGENEFEGPSVEYTPAQQPGRLGRLLARGPGRLRGNTREQPGKIFEARWQERLIIQPHQGEHAVSLLGEARVQYDALGEFAAEALHMWLRETQLTARAGEKPRFSYQPVRMLAQGAVRLDSPQLTGATQKVELWLRYAEEPEATDEPAAGLAAALPGRLPEAPQSAQRFEVFGDHLQVQVLRAGQRTEVEHLILDGNVRLHELQTAKPGEVPLRAVGDLVQIESANTPRTRLRIQGSPAEVGARGLAASGENIQLHREHNSLWILGPGTMTLPLPADRFTTSGTDASAKPPVAPIPLTVHWQKRMIFDGRAATFEQQVELHGRQESDSGEEFKLLASGEELVVTLDRSVDFGANSPPDAEVEQAQFRGPVLLQNTSHRLGAPTSIDRLHIRDLSLYPPSGRLQAVGPGWGTSVRIGQQLPGVARDPAAGDEAAKLSFLRVDFEEQIEGNIHNRDLEFRGRVRTLYGPVSGWQEELDPEPRGGLPKDVFLLTSQRLGLAQMPAMSAGESAAIEVVAEGNATVEGTEFSARGWRISYARAKELLILEGDGRSDAELWIKGSTTPDAAAQQIRFWTNNNSIQVDGGRFFNLGNVGGLTR